LLEGEYCIFEDGAIIYLLLSRKQVDLAGFDKNENKNGFDV